LTSLLSTCQTLYGIAALQANSAFAQKRCGGLPLTTFPLPTSARTALASFLERL